MGCSGLGVCGSLASEVLVFMALRFCVFVFLGFLFCCFMWCGSIGFREVACFSVFADWVRLVVPWPQVGEMRGSSDSAALGSMRSRKAFLREGWSKTRATFLVAESGACDEHACTRLAPAQAYEGFGVVCTINERAAAAMDRPGRLADWSLGRATWLCGALGWHLIG
jgi:hypothetical protein